jgi:NAD+ kinase
VEKVFRTVGLVARCDNKVALKLAEDLAVYLKGKGLKVYIEDTLRDLVKAKAEFVALSELNVDFIITIGGDGTILRTCIAAPKPEPPILTINMGVRGFLTEVEPARACEALDRILKGDYKIEKCAKLSVQVGKDKLPDALNDVVISACELSKILYSDISKNGKHILKCQADGLIVSTQTGSTGYSLSAGGPVLDQEVDAFVVTPICSLTIFRSLVFPADSVLAFKVQRPKELLVLVDGNFRRLTKCEETIKVTRSKNETSFIRFETDFDIETDFYDRLRNRLLFKGTE